ncbi:hypothetical protein ACSBR2_000126 [Camellia fascicularis]
MTSKPTFSSTNSLAPVDGGRGGAMVREAEKMRATAVGWVYEWVAVRSMSLSGVVAGEAGFGGGGRVEEEREEVCTGIVESIAVARTRCFQFGEPLGLRRAWRIPGRRFNSTKTALPFESSHFLSTLQLISNAKDLDLSPKKNSIPSVPQEILVLSLVILHPQECWMMYVVFTAFLHSVDTVIANEKDWGIDLLNENVNEFGTNEDGSLRYQENGEDLGENGYRCRWTRMGGQSHDGSSEWKERWEKSDWTGYKELGVKKSGRNAEGDLCWETWQEVLHQDESNNLARIERSAQKQAKSGTENAGWWEKYDAEGWTEKGAHTNKWAETELATEWGDKWEKFFAGIGLLQGETWHVDLGHGVKSTSEMVRCTNMVRAQQVKVGILLWMRKLTMRLNLIMDGQMWWAIQVSCCPSNLGRGHQVSIQILILGYLRNDDHHYCQMMLRQIRFLPLPNEKFNICTRILLMDEPYYGWADVVGNQSQLLSIEPWDRPPGVYRDIDFGSSSQPPPPPDDVLPDTLSLSSQ